MSGILILVMLVSGGVLYGADPYRPLYHVTPPENWMNDPNGVIQAPDGTYHFFYQHCPSGTTWCKMHWRHTTSPDMMHWTDQGIKLYPDQWYDNNLGCWSGSAVMKDGLIHLVYTGNGSGQQTAIAVADDPAGSHFSKYGGNPVMSQPPGTCCGFRDPKAWRHNNQWWVVTGTIKDGSGAITLHRSDNLFDWQFVNTIIRTNTGFAECPDFFRLGDKDIIVFSPEDSRQVRYYTGNLDYNSGNYTPDGDHSRVDYGSDFYASQSFLSNDGRRIMVSWMAHWAQQHNHPSASNGGWAGALTVPREVTLGGDGTLRYRPVREVELLRSNDYQGLSNAVISPGTEPVINVRGKSAEIIAEFEWDGASLDPDRFGFYVRRSADGFKHTQVFYEPANQILKTNRHSSGIARTGDYTAPLASENNRVRMHILVDSCSVEVFGNERTTITTTIFPDEDHDYIKLFTEGGDVRVVSMEIWKLTSEGGWAPVNPSSNVTATAQSAGEVHLTWQDNADDEDGFTVQRMPWMREHIWHDMATLPVDATSYTDTASLHGMVEYTYRVGAFKNP